MKTTIFALVGLLFATSAHADLKDSEAFLLNTAMGPVGQQIQLGTKLQQGGVEVVQCVYDYSVLGGNHVKVFPLCELPSKSIVKRVYYKIVTRPVGSDSTVTYSIGASTFTNLVNATDLKDAPSVGVLKAGAIDDALTSFIMPSATSTVKVNLQLAGGDFTAGKIIFIVEYVKGKL